MSDDRLLLPDDPEAARLALTYTREITVPKDVPSGTYRIGVGLYDRDGAQGNLKLETAPGVTSDGYGRCDVGTV